MGWSFGLPEEPEDSDYLAIVMGERSFRIEAEDAKGATDPVSVKDFTTFGPFSGRGWVSGSATPAALHLHFILPVGGLYRMNASVRLPGIEVLLGDRSFSLDGTNRFTLQELGEIELSAGEHEITVHIPPNGSIDYIGLKAPSLPAVEPLDGWDLDAPLTSEDIAVTTIQLLELDRLLPLTQTRLNIEAESASDIGTTERTEVRHLGPPSGKSWLRAGAVETTARIDFDLLESGCYTVALRGLGALPLSGKINDNLPYAEQFPSYLKTLDIGTWFFRKGENSISITLPPRAGIDLLSITKRGEDAAALQRLVGLMSEKNPSTSTMDAMISLLSVLTPPR